MTVAEHIGMNKYCYEHSNPLAELWHLYYPLLNRQ